MLIKLGIQNLCRKGGARLRLLLNNATMRNLQQCGLSTNWQKIRLRMSIVWMDEWMDGCALWFVGMAPCFCRIHPYLGKGGMPPPPNFLPQRKNSVPILSASNGTRHLPLFHFRGWHNILTVRTKHLRSATQPSCLNTKQCWCIQPISVWKAVKQWLRLSNGCQAIFPSRF